MKKVSGVQLVSAVRYIRGDVNGKQEFVSAIDPATFAQVAPLKLVAGSQQTLSRGGVLLDDSRAKAKDVGNRVTLKLAGGSRDTTIAGIYEKTPTPRGYLISLDTANSLGVQELDNMDFVVLQPGADRTRVQADLTKVIKAQPLLSVRDQADYADQAREPIDQVLRMIYALLGLSIVIAVVGIVNTLSLSVIERVREIGLLRAVGLTRAQLRRMIRLEAVVIALLGATLGVVLGTLFGIALQRSLADQGITALSIPWASLAIFLGAAAFVGVVAALWPAFRASRMNVLEAISTE